VLDDAGCGTRTCDSIFLTPYDIHRARAFVKSTVNYPSRPPHRVQPGTFAVPHREAKNDFAWMDIQGIARHTGLNASSSAAPAGHALTSSASGSAATTAVDAAASGAAAPPAVLVEVIEPSPARGGVFPLTRQMATLAETFVMPDTHLIYAGTWYTLAFFGSVIAWVRFRRRTQLTGRHAQRRYYPGQN
jgi:cytochrome oxidase assembly protein ShyY1